MKVLLRCRVTGNYVGENGVFTQSPDLARTFESGQAAKQYCVAGKLTDCEIIFKFREPQRTFSLPVQLQPERSQQFG